MCHSVSQCVTVCHSVLQCVAVCCTVLQCVVVCCSALQCVAVCCNVLQHVAVWNRIKCLNFTVCCSVSQCVTVCHSVSQCVTVRCSALQCIAVRCSVLQCVAVCHSENPHQMPCLYKSRVLFEDPSKALVFIGFWRPIYCLASTSPQYRVVKTHRMPYVCSSFFSTQPYNLSLDGSWYMGWLRLVGSLKW